MLYRDDKVVAFFPLEPATTGHTLVIPHRHVVHFDDLERHDARDLAGAVQRVPAALNSALSSEGLNLIQSNGAAVTQTVPHVHFRPVPRADGDRMILQWPDGASDTPETQDQTLSLIRAHLSDQQPETSPEDRRQHRSFVQAVITRMSQASTSSKTWLLPIVTATFGYAITKDVPGVALLGCLAVFLFGLMDANYLKQERAFRKLYDQVAQGSPISAFAMNPALAFP